MAARSATRQAEAELLKFALAYPEAYKDSPWGDQVVKVKKKIFVFVGVAGRELHLTVKLPESAAMALGLPFVSPTGYGLGKSGWVTARFGPRDQPPVPVLRQWIDESYRAVAPKKLVGQLVVPGPEPPAAARPARRPRRRG